MMDRRSLLVVFIISAANPSGVLTNSTAEHKSSINEKAVNVPWVAQILTQKMISYVPSGLEAEGSLCSRHGKQYEIYLRNLTFWATKMFDARASGVSSGLLYGNDFNMGNFDECVSIFVPELGIRGKYMIASLEFSPDERVCPYFLTDVSTVYQDPQETESIWGALKPTTDLRMRKRNVLRWALCVPDSCSEKDIESSLRDDLYPTLSANYINAHITILPEFTFTMTDPKREATGYYVFVCATIVLLALVIASTTIDFIRGDNKAIKQWYMNFSLNMHLPALFSKKRGEFTTMSGVKSVSMFIIIIGHRMLATYDSPMFNSKENDLLVGSLMSMMFHTGILIVNTFMLITGFLTFRKFIKDIKEGREINVWLQVAMRWCRLIPAYLFVFALHNFVLLKHGSGPISRVIFDSTTCGENWWAHLLFINNYIGSEHQCFLISWYLAVDFQLFTFIAFLAYLYSKFPRYGPHIIGTVAFIGFIIPGIYVLTKNYSGITMMLYRNSREFFRDKEFVEMYIYAHSRATPHLMGVLGAFVYFYLKEIKYAPTKRTVWLLTIGSVLLLVATLLSPSVFYTPGRPYVLWEHVLYAVLHRICWSVAILWIIIAGCVADNFGPLKHTVGVVSFEPFNKLTYCALLIHTPIQVYLAGFIRTPVFINRLLVIWMGFADLCFTYLTSIIIYCLIEAPFAALQGYFFLMFRNQKTVHDKE